MKTTFSLSTFLGLAGLVAGCDGTLPTHPVQGDPRLLQNYTRQPNGTGIHIGSTQPESWFGLAGTSLTWFMDGFSQRADGSFWARGWYSVDAGLIAAEAQVLRAEQGDASFLLKDIRTVGSRLQIDIADAQGTTRTLQDGALNGLTLVLRVPDLTGLLPSTYRLRITSSQILDSEFGDVYGYGVEARSSAPTATWSSYCRGPGDVAQGAVFYQGSQWNPLDGSRSDGSTRITMTCETGSVARCMRWGYRPWGSAANAQGVSTSLAEHHQACIHMKRASYCGDSRSNTIDGTWIYIQDQLSPNLHAGSLDTIEAVWTAQGAACLSNRRHPELLFLGCAQPLPTCTAAQQANFLLATGLSPSGSLLGLAD